MQQRKKIHPHKFTLWVAMASIMMMFAGLTSAYIVKGSQPGWTGVILPKLFYISTACLLLSSLTMQVALKSFRERNRVMYRRMISATFVLGLLFIGLQVAAFYQMMQEGYLMKGSGAAQFLYIIFGLHALHVLGGVIALLVIFLRAFSTRIRSYNPVPVEVITTYWHFVDLLWIYLLVFFIWNV